jgi:hypothetical protein
MACAVHLTLAADADAELEAEGMMELPSLPSPKTTNGTWIHVEARHNIILSMITWNDKWGPRYISRFHVTCAD